MVYIKFEGYKNELMQLNNFIIDNEESQMINKSQETQTGKRYQLKGSGKE